AIETIAKKHQYNKLTMNAQLQARDFYLKLGYSPFGKVFLEENIKHISMNKFL
ncbi:MAG: GNAT family N-acetyltransferase, partial [Staphylococcus epidermidis]|nr:GNAT family N-acetyltransferase [Staphylococcus epidermidis]